MNMHSHNQPHNQPYSRSRATLASTTPSASVAPQQRTAGGTPRIRRQAAAGWTSALASAGVASVVALTGASASLAADTPAATDEPSMSIALEHSVKGKTLTYTYRDGGRQYALTDDSGKRYFSPESMGFTVDFGDGTPSDGADGAGGSDCLTNGPVKPFGMTMPTATHTYAKAGAYTVTVTGVYCGKPGASSVTRTYRVQVGANDAKPSPSVPATAIPAPTKPTHNGPTHNGPATSVPTPAAPASTKPEPGQPAPTGASAPATQSGPKVDTGVERRASAGVRLSNFDIAIGIALAGGVVLAAFGLARRLS